MEHSPHKNNGLWFLVLIFDLIWTTTLLIWFLIVWVLKFIPEFSNNLCIPFDVFKSRKTDTDILLQTDELNQQQAMQKAEEVHQFRQYRSRILSIRDIDQEERLKIKDKVLEMYGEMQVSSKVHILPSQPTNSFVILKRY